MDRTLAEFEFSFDGQPWTSEPPAAPRVLTPQMLMDTMHEIEHAPPYRGPQYILSPRGFKILKERWRALKEDREPTYAEIEDWMMKTCDGDPAALQVLIVSRVA